MRTVAKMPVLGPMAVFAYRGSLAVRHLFAIASRLARWWFTSRETSNFTYGLETTNRAYLVALIADVTGTGAQVVQRLVEEIEADESLKTHIRSWARARGERTDLARRIEYGRRIAWYAAVRLLKPRVVVETGVDKGLGSCVLAAALLRNAAEGFPGRYYGTDINPAAGGLFCGEYARTGTILYGDSVRSLAQLEERIDFFINDSDHSADYEALEYETVSHKLSERAVIFGDNAHVTDRLLGFAARTGRTFLFFQERPRRHWYPGGGIGIAFVRN